MFAPGPIELIIILGVVLFPLVLAAVVYLAVRYAMPKRATPPCPQCGSWTVAGAGFCHRCGSQLPTRQGS